jgi:hypothetical protein
MTVDRANRLTPTSHNLQIKVVKLVNEPYSTRFADLRFDAVFGL